jgi:methylamine dehydrogenase accessory protein MauD
MSRWIIGSRGATGYYRTGITFMTALAVSNVILWIVVLALLVVVLALTRQVGVLHERIAPAGALMINRGLAVGELVPAIDVVDLNGRGLRVGEQRPDGLSTLILFVSPTCPVCESLLPALKSSRKDEQSWLQILLASDGEPAAHREFVRSHGLLDFPYIVSAPLGMTYQVSRLPFAALLDSAGKLRARGLVNSREHLESLFEAKRLGVASLQEYFSSRAQTSA